MKKKYYSPITKFFVTTMCLLLWDIMDKCVRFSFKKKKKILFTLVLKLLVVVRKKEIWNFCIAVTERIRENEAVKMIRLKEGFVRIAEAYVELGKKCSTVFQAQKVNTEIICILTLKGSLNITVVQWIISLQKGNNFHVRRVRAR